MNSKGEIFFDMTKDSHPLYGKSMFLLKRWKKYSIYAPSSSYTRTDNPWDTLYSTSSVYLYDYVIVTSDWFNSIVYNTETIDSTPSNETDQSPPDLWIHRESTFRSSSNATTNNYQLTYDPEKSAPLGDVSINGVVGQGRPVHGPPLIFTDSGEYFEIVGGYPRNHFTHKRDVFSLYQVRTYGKEARIITSGSYKRCQQTITSTIGEDGLEDGSSPVQITQVSNLNLIQSDNVINK